MTIADASADAHHRRHDGKRGHGRRHKDKHKHKHKDKHAHKHKSRRSSASGGPLPASATPIAPSDFYARSREFRAWLAERGKTLSELPSEKAHELFEQKVC